MALTLALNAIISPMKTAISWTTLNTETSFVRRNSVTVYASNKSTEAKTEVKILPGVKQRLDTYETIVSLDRINRQLQVRVQRIKKIMASKSTKYDHAEELVMIDAIQRLGLSYYFHDEIHGTLGRQYESFVVKEGNHDLYATALRFRLLRQQGYNVTADFFSKFKDMNGNFKPELEKDSKGLMSLFEACQMRMHEEHILDDAAEFSMHHLKQMKNKEQSEDSIIKNTLTNPFHKSVSRLMAKSFVQNFEISIKLLHEFSDESSNWIKEMQNLAEINIKINQINHQNEITQLLRWSKGLQLTEELKLARIKPEKWHMWSSACLPAPNMVQQRIELTKAASIVYIIDDIYDVYGTLEELTLFTEAVDKWKYDNITGLPNYMTVCLKTLYEEVDHISYETYDKHGWNPKELQKGWKETCNAFLVEAKWFASGHTPSTDEYSKNGIVSGGFNIIYAYLFLFLGGGKNTGRDMLTRCPYIVYLAATILRLGNDLGNPKDKNPYGYDGSFVDCFMNEHLGSSTENAQEHGYRMITDAWKCLNEACVSSTPSTVDFKEAVLNIARFSPVIYSYDNSHRLPSLEKHKKSYIISEQINEYIGSQKNDKPLYYSIRSKSSALQEQV